VRQGPAAALGPGLRDADLRREELAVDVDERDERDRRLQQPRREPREPVEALVRRSVEQAGRAQRLDARRIIGLLGDRRLLGDPDGDRDPHARPLARGRLHLEHAARGADPLARRGQADVPGLQRLLRPRGDDHPAPVVLDAQHDRVGHALEADDEPRGVGVLDGVRDELARRRVEHGVVRADGIGVDVQVDLELRPPRGAVELDVERDPEAAVGERRRVQAHDGVAQGADGVRQRLVGVLERLQVARARLADVLLGGEQRLQRVVVQALADARALALLGVERLVQERGAVGAELAQLQRPAPHGAGEQDADPADDEQRDERLGERRVGLRLPERRGRDRDEARGRERRDDGDRPRGVREPHRHRVDHEREARLGERPAAGGDQREEQADVGDGVPQRLLAGSADGEDRQPRGIGRGERDDDEEGRPVVGGTEQHAHGDKDHGAGAQCSDDLR